MEPQRGRQRTLVKTAQNQKLALPLRKAILLRVRVTPLQIKQTRILVWASKECKKDFRADDTYMHCIALDWIGLDCIAS